MDTKVIIDTALEVIEVEADAVRKLSNSINENFVNACKYLLEASSPVIITGMGKSAHVGKKIAATMTSTGTPAIFMHSAEAIHGDLGITTSGSVVIAISYSGNTEEVLRLLPIFKRFGTPIISITGNPESQLARLSTVNIDASVEKEACPHGLAPTASTTAALVIGDALAMSLLRVKGFSDRDFATFHPGGSLGRKLLTTVSDVMREGEAVPMVASGTLLKEALMIISEKMLGLVLIVDNLNNMNPIGLFTDGDVRRALNNGYDINTTLIDDVMTTNFKTIKSDAPTSEAINLMEKFKVFAFPVIDKKGKLTGAFNMHDLIDAKVI